MGVVQRTMAIKKLVGIESRSAVISSITPGQKNQFVRMMRVMEIRLLKSISGSVEYLVEMQKIPGLEKKVSEAFCLRVLRRQYAFLDHDHISQLEALMSDNDPRVVAIMASSLRTYNLKIVRQIQSLISETQKRTVETFMKRDEIMYGGYAQPGEDRRDPKVIMRKMVYELVIAQHMKEKPTEYLFSAEINGEEKQLNTTEYLSYLETLSPSERKKLGTNLYKAYIQGLTPDARASFEDKSVNIIINASQDMLEICYKQAYENLASAAKRSNPQVNSGFIFEPYTVDDKGTIVRPDDEYVARIDERSMASAGILSSESDPSQTPFSLTRFSQNLRDFIARFEGVDVSVVSTEGTKSPTQSVFYSYGRQSQTSEVEDPETGVRKKPGPGRGYDDAT